MRKLLLIPSLILTFVCLDAQVFAQAISNAKTTYKPLVKKLKPISKELSVGARLNSDGWGIYVDKGYVRSQETKLSDQFHDVRVFQVELDEHKDPKEIKHAMSDQGSGGSQKAKPFVFGKINNFYALKLGYGMRKMIAGKPEPGTVSIHWVNLGGLSLGMEKPYYLDGYVPQDNFGGTYVPATFKYSDATKQSFLDERYINGGAGFQKGLNEIQFVPGVHAKSVLHFDFSTGRRTLMALEAGINIEYYTRAIQIMANQDVKPYFVNLFASLQFGRRW